MPSATAAHVAVGRAVGLGPAEMSPHVSDHNRWIVICPLGAGILML